MKTPQEIAIDAVKKLSNEELLEILCHYNLYATSIGGKERNPLVIPGPQMLKEIKRRLKAAPEQPTEHPMSGVTIEI